MGRTVPSHTETASGDDGISRPYENIWRSERLLYRAIDPKGDDKAFYRDIMADPIVAAQGVGGLMRPMAPEEHDADLEGVAKAMLGVAICLRPEEEAKHGAPSAAGGLTGDAKPEDGQVEEDSKKPKKPTTVGFFALDMHPLVKHHRSCSLMILIGPEFQNKGYGTEAINWGLDWAFRYGGVHAVRLGVFAYNTGAIRLYERLGFLIEGRKREALWFDRKWHDSLNYAILEDEWAAMRGLPS